MSTRSPSMERICTAAVLHFAENGYDGGSLSEIAAAVGIKKASLYAHFSGKDSLFLQVFQDAIDDEMSVAMACFDAEKANELPGWRYVMSLDARWLESAHFRLLIRTAYVPPLKLKTVVVERYRGFCDHLRNRFERRLKEVYPLLPGRNSATFGLCYAAIVDSLHVELQYSDGRDFVARSRALRQLLTNGLTLAQRP